MSETALVPEGIFDNFKNTILRTVLFSQKDRIKDAVILIVENTRDYAVDFVESNWDAIFDQLAVVLKLTTIPESCDADGNPRYVCDFNPDEYVAVPGDGAESIAGIVQFVLFIMPYIIRLFA